MPTADDIFYVTPRNVPADILDREIAHLARAWNKSTREAREDFLDMATEVDGGFIDI